MPAIGPSYQLPTPQANQMATVGYPRFGGSMHPLGQPTTQGANTGATNIPGQLVATPGAGYINKPAMSGQNMLMSGPGFTGMTMHDQAEAARMAQDYEALVNIIKQWNANRLDLFALTLPNEVRL